LAQEQLPKAAPVSPMICVGLHMTYTTVTHACLASHNRPFVIDSHPFLLSRGSDQAQRAPFQGPVQSSPVQSSSIQFDQVDQPSPAQPALSSFSTPLLPWGSFGLSVVTWSRMFRGRAFW
jgi:hypothetical protein